MIPELGHYALVLALLVAAFQSVVPLIGAARGDGALMASAVPAAQSQFILIAAAFGALEPVAGPARGNGPAAYHRLPGAVGSVGVITPMTHTYCGSCNRVRLTADGRLRTCLFGDHEVDLRTPLRAGVSLEPFVLRALAEKPEAHALLARRVGGLRALSQVGG
jgi:molybdenum cofactor biosynthesis enzyme MoaA